MGPSVEVGPSVGCSRFVHAKLSSGLKVGGFLLVACVLHVAVVLFWGEKPPAPPRQALSVVSISWEVREGDEVSVSDH